MKKMAILIAAACLFISTALTAEAGDAKQTRSEKKGKVNVKLKASPKNAGAIGEAIFARVDDKTCEVNLTLVRISQMLVTQPLRIQTYIYPGSCENLSENPAYELNDTTVTDNKGLNQNEVSKKIPVPLRTLLDNDHAIVIRSVPSDGNHDLFCGDIR